VASKSIVMIRAPVDVFPTSVRPIRLTRGQTIPRHVWALAVGAGAVKATRVDPNTLDGWNEGGFFRFPYEVKFLSFIRKWLLLIQSKLFSVRGLREENA
jgi:hypothetical protein